MTISTIDNVHELEGIRACWEKWADHPDNDFDHFRLVCELRREVLGPYVFVIERDGEASGLFAGRLENTYVEPSIGYFKPFRISAKMLVFSKESFLGEMNEWEQEAIFLEALKMIKSSDVTGVVFYNFEEESYLLKRIMGFQPVRNWGKRGLWNLHWSMDVPHEVGGLLRKLKSKHRTWIRGRETKLREAFSDDVEWRWLCKFDDLQVLCERLEEVAAVTYHRGLGAGFKYDEEHLKRFELFSAKGQLRVQVLEISNRVRAFWIGVIYQGVFFHR